MNFIKHIELRNLSPSVEMIPAQNVNQIIYGCCASIVVVNITGICTLVVLKTNGSSDVVWVPCFSSVLMLWPY